jgi:hypothetical protein
MTERVARRMAVVLTAAGMLAGCASFFGAERSNVVFRTVPVHADCAVAGPAFHRTVATPARIAIPSSATPLTVTCVAKGYRKRVMQLRSTSDGWVWSRSMMAAVDSGAAALGLTSGSGHGTGPTYGRLVRITLDRRTPHSVFLRQRDGGRTIEIEAR